MTAPKREITERAVIPQKAPGCSLESWGGAFAISDKLEVFEADTRGVANWVVSPGGMTRRTRAALADYMIGLWTRFKDGKEPG